MPRGTSWQHAGGTMHSLLYPVSNEREALRRQGLTPKNHAKENMRMVNEQSKKRTEQAASRPSHTPEPFKMERFKHAESTVRQQMQGEWQRPQTAESVHGFMRKGEASRRCDTARASTPSVAVARPTTADTSQAPRQRPQSAKPRVPSKQECRVRDEEIRRVTEAPSPDHLRRNALAAIRGEVPSKERAAPLTARDRNTASAASTPERHESYGRVPGYLLQRKQDALERKHQASERLIDHPTDCPPGMRLMRDEERKATLVRLRDSRVSILKGLSELPFLVDTPSMQAHKTEMERRLVEVEKAISLYSRTRIFVKCEISGF